MAPTPGSARKSKRDSSSGMDKYVAEFLKRVVQRLSLAEGMTILKAWGFLTEKELDMLSFKQKKDNFTIQVVNLCEGKKATLDDAADLDLVYNHAHSSKKTWAVYQMLTPTDSDMDLIDVVKLKAQFKKAICGVMKNVSIHFHEFGEALWIRIAWGRNDGTPNQYKPTFVVYHLQTPYVFLAALTKSDQPLLFQALLFATGFCTMQRMELKSHSLESLKDIVFKRFNQPFQSYHPQPIQEKTFAPPQVDQRVTYENLREMERIDKATRETFGDGPLPRLEAASYLMETTFKGEVGIAKEIKPFRCVVKFSSPHLLESFRSLAPAGLAEVPVSPLLSCIPDKARNCFKITDKKTRTKPRRDIET